MKSPLSKETVAKLRWLQGKLRKYPHRYDQGNWCGTRACLAGFCLPKVAGTRGVTLSSKQSSRLLWEPPSVVAQKWLGISEDQADQLFYSWPVPFNGMLNRAKTDEARAAVAIRRINHLIRTGE